MDGNTKESGDPEINKALAELAAERAQEQALKNPVKDKALQAPGMAGWVMKFSGGLIKNEKQAEYVLVFITILFFLISFYLFFAESIAQKISPPPLLPPD